MLESPECHFLREAKASKVGLSQIGKGLRCQEEKFGLNLEASESLARENSVPVKDLKDEQKLVKEKDHLVHYY